MTRLRKHKHESEDSDQHDQPHIEGSADISTEDAVSYAPPPGPPQPEAATDVSDTVQLHPQATHASFLRLVSSSSPSVAAETGPTEDHVHFVDILDNAESTSDSDLPVSQHATAEPESDHTDHTQAESSQAALPRIAVHAKADSIVQTSAAQQSFTISAGLRSQKLYYLWSPKHKQPDAAAAGESYAESFDNGKRRLLKQGSSPSADVTKQQVARMATWVPDPNDDKHSRKHMRPWWVRLLNPQKPRKGDTEALGADDSSSDPDDEPKAPSWRWKLVLFLCCLVAMICYVDRAAMSVAIIPMSIEYGWDNSVKGAINR